MTSNKILIRPLVSEKSAVLEQMGTYAFVVDIKANKFQVKEAIREVYGVMPKKVRILNVEGKRTSFGQRLGKRSDWKKAFIKLPKGKTINIHEGV
ncbi:MAG: 50S ribosomal protein L23 [Candidatus Magasanikbacteria bacterium RIFCSPHIGHO2_01_FULL_33_34]|uniref:Large ribosomal subunit protein uL23 n=1 Tax=Candidatus Magasanikbacteria bacterium RIFCSPHIGHO2_01_FULL_33_34 TaxID=1798671 RepID=A0A1F6LLL6_9BACT|nr:MAG: 50S ribosomal protein L23 [Candidatus Magasanikbacteria bacterium RIFCSPHIGHO2_01_FULL_33_34]OGH66004.1 MAG: 50S ribosomal protein L23 [Candidatus Magasanikbacteria bacterium RIFCSPHIGHO2_02_FULL_33_17]OGH76399.1 MAG: 50S ribosomal protein L23 [Candidatus Magasanikbacteria bacterium RIFCSPLOWO2_01_FULL_33_34]OGH81505.1 MAG: 50S ribosomal protein L23 [Candidatus Magasanikbacteria bacterium RIFCSPLOWO2_12_FULL_34_7]